MFSHSFSVTPSTSWLSDKRPPLRWLSISKDNLCFLHENVLNVPDINVLISGKCTEDESAKLAVFCSGWCQKSVTGNSLNRTVTWLTFCPPLVIHAPSEHLLLSPKTYKNIYTITDVCPCLGLGLGLEAWTHVGCKCLTFRRLYYSSIAYDRRRSYRPRKPVDS